MESKIQINTNNLWEDPGNLEQIRQLFAPSLTAIEFQFFIGLGKAAGLNPFAREIWCVKYGTGAAQVFIGRDGYRRAALSHPDYDYHQCDTVYENDGFEVTNGEIKHTYNLKDRGKIRGAYCITKRLKSSRPVYIFVHFNEYNTGKSLWASKPDVMIRKVAEANGLRAAFQDLLGGTYAPEEMPEGMSGENKDGRDGFHGSGNRGVPDSSGFSGDLDWPCDETITDEQLEALTKLIEVKDFSLGRVQKAMTYYGVDALEKLTPTKLKDFMKKLGAT